MERRNVLPAGLSGVTLGRDEIIRRLTQPRRGDPTLRGDHMLDRAEPHPPPLKPAAAGRAGG